MDINIILILLIIHMAWIIAFKPKSENLSCGIFGWSGKSAKSFNKAKFDIQGLYNNSRGGDSCGVSTDGEIYYGITGSKHYSDFLHRQSYEPPTEVPTVIGHTRKSSSGAVNSDNAHPFGFGDKDSKFEFVGVHNGTLHNQEDLAKKYNLPIEVNKKNKFGAMVFDRKKIDSEILLEIIYKERNFRVLSDYIGGAALLFTNINESNVLYVFKGASRFDSHDTGIDIEERPLYYYKEHKNSLYISSMQESLEAIGGVANENLFKFNENVVYKIKDGNIDISDKFDVSRRQAHQRPAVARRNYDYCGYNFQKNEIEKAFEENDKKTKKEDGVINIQEEKEERIFRSPIVFNKLRYSRNGHLIEGIYTWIKDYGFFPFGKDKEEAELNCKVSIDKAFDTEYAYFVDKKEVIQNDPDIIYPFTTKNKITPKIFYFYEGVMLETELDFEILNARVRTYSIWDLSDMSKHPVMELKSKNPNAHIYGKILHKRNSFTGNIAPLGCSKIYYIEKGDLVNVIKINKLLPQEKESAVDKYEKKHKEGDQLLLLGDGKNSDEELIQKQFKDFCQTNELEVKDDFDCEDSEIHSCISDEVAKQGVDDLMIPIYLKIQESVLELYQFGEINFVKDIIDLNEEYLVSLDEIIDKTYK